MSPEEIIANALPVTLDRRYVAATVATALAADGLLAPNDPSGRVMFHIQAAIEAAVPAGLFLKIRVEKAPNR